MMIEKGPHMTEQDAATLAGIKKDMAKDDNRLRDWAPSDWRRQIRRLIEIIERAN